MNENETVTALKEIRDLIHNVVVSRFDILETRLDAIETKLDAVQGVNGTLAGVQRF